MVAYSRRTDTTDVKLSSNNKPDVHTHTHTKKITHKNWPVVKRCLMGLTVAAGEDCALPRGLWSNEDWNTPSCCKAWWEGEERQRRRGGEKVMIHSRRMNQRSVHSLQWWRRESVRVCVCVCVCKTGQHALHQHPSCLSICRHTHRNYYNYKYCIIS